MKVYSFDNPKEAFIACGNTIPAGAKEVLPNSVEAAVEKHIPDLTVEGNVIRAVVGSTVHPMLDAHYIMWIALENGNQVLVQELKPSEAPEAVFTVAEIKEGAKVYAFCNLHGLWVKEVK